MIKRLAILFLLSVGVARAQTSIPIPNGDFSAHGGFTVTNSSNAYNFGPIPNWPASSTQDHGSVQFTSLEYSMKPIPPMAYSNGATLTSSDLGPLPQAGSYTANVLLGNRLDGYGAPATGTLTLLAGSIPLCTASLAVNTITPGTLAPLNCSYQTPATLPTGDLSIALACSANQCDWAAASLTIAGPLTIQFSGLNGGQGFTATFPVASLNGIPSCATADQDCSLTLQVSMAAGALCSTDASGNTTCTGSVGSVAIVKTTSNNGTQTVPIVQVTAGP
jgi:hapalindole biogenesis HpiC1 cyclase-like protein